MPLQETFKNYIDNNLVFLKESRIVIAISGGVDSVVLAHLCKASNLNIALAHCNFNLRGEESKADENFVLDLGDVLDVEVFVQNFNTQSYANTNKLSIQMAARELRYNWFKDLAQQLQFDVVLTAHHADDNLETFLINFLRGTGINGLTGIPKEQGIFVRPLLDFSRDSILDYAKLEGITWREDSSNSSRKYLRNKLRHEVVPILKEINPQLLDSFQNTVSYLNDTASILDQEIEKFSKNAIEKVNDNGTYFKVAEFKKLSNPKAYVFELFKDYGFTEWNDVLDLLKAETGKYVKSNTHRLIKHREFLILADHQSNNEEEVFDINSLENTIATPIGNLLFDKVETLVDNSRTCIYVDKERLSFPVQLRLWQQDDVFYPLGMKGKKRLSKYLKDEKLSLVEKENTWVLVSNHQVVWVVGMRADNRFKVTDSTSEIFKIELK